MSRDPESGRFLPGNRFWEARSSHGASPKFAGPEPLWEACCEYFAWNHENPLYADQLVTFQGAATHEPVAKMRAMTIGGLCMFLGVSHDTWIEWRKTRADLSEVITRAEAVIYRQKFEGASADLLNGSIIARDLGLKDTSRVEGPGPNGEHTVETRDTNPLELARRIAFALARGVEDTNGEPG